MNESSFNNIFFERGQFSVLSLFDGMSCGQIALNRIGLKPGQYFASEIDKYAMKITQANFPETIQLGDVRNVHAKDLPKIDLLIGGSPCQGFSFAGKGLNFEDERSKLFFEFVRLKNELKPKYFLMENVRMAKQHELIISKYLGVEPVPMDSNLVSAQNRYRLYWTNINQKPFGLFGEMKADVPKPVDKKIYWGDVREHNVEAKFYYSKEGLEWIKRHGIRKNKKLRIQKDKSKFSCVDASFGKNYAAQRYFAIEDVKGLRYITPTECERLQTLPDGYTNGVSNFQRYKMIGNGWNIDTICHFLSFLRGEKKYY